MDFTLASFNPEEANIDDEEFERTLYRDVFGHEKGHRQGQEGEDPGGLLQQQQIAKAIVRGDAK